MALCELRGLSSTRRNLLATSAPGNASAFQTAPHSFPKRRNSEPGRGLGHIPPPRDFC